MEFTCTQASASEAGDEIFQVLFQNNCDPEDFDSPYLLIQRAWLEEDEGGSDGIYVECTNIGLCGHYSGGVVAELTRDSIHLHLPAPANEVIKVRFKASDQEYKEISEMLALMLNDQKY